MKRLITSVCVAVLLAAVLAAPAEAGTRTLKGPVDGGGTFKFKLRVHNGTPVKAGNFKARRIPVECDNGPVEKVRFSLDAFIDVNGAGEFEYDFSSFNAHLDGTIKPNNRKATGEISYGPSDVGGSDNCTTGGLRGYTAKKI